MNRRLKFWSGFMLVWAAAVLYLMSWQEFLAIAAICTTVGVVLALIDDRLR